MIFCYTELWKKNYFWILNGLQIDMNKTLNGDGGHMKVQDFLSSIRLSMNYLGCVISENNYTDIKILDIWMNLFLDHKLLFNFYLGYTHTLQYLYNGQRMNKLNWNYMGKIITSASTIMYGP